MGVGIRRIIRAVDKTRRVAEKANKVLFPDWIYNQPTVWDELLEEDQQEEDRPWWA